MMKETTVEFEFEKETKNTVRYQEVVEEGKPSVVGTIYVQRWAAGSTKRFKAVLTPMEG